MIKINIFYVGSFPNEYFKKILSESKVGSQICAQKFNNMIINGLNYNQVKVTVIVTDNPLMQESNNRYNKSFTIVESGIKYYFAPVLKIRILGILFTSICIKKFLNDNIDKNGNNALMFDILKPYVFTLVKSFSRYNSNIISLFTDLPNYFVDEKSGLYWKAKKMYNESKQKYIYSKISLYILITKYMREKLPINDKKWIVIEGLVEKKEISVVSGNKKNIIMYAGDMSKLYGLDKLIKVFESHKVVDYELHLFGRCDYLNEIEKICDENDNIKFFGIVENEIILEKQKQAKLLINPRPINLDFNRYSFPSKIIEYMSSGTPVLTTKLEGIPSSYDPYLYYILDDSIDGIAKQINLIINLDQKELDDMGCKAKNFVESEKNNIIQTKRILDMLDKEGNI